MKNWRVVFEVYRGNGREFKHINVVAGNKKLAMTRAMIEINKLEGYSDLYKKVNSIEEVA